ncbi:MAG: outer membrane lipoprotein carrier protein LolA [Bacteroidia bacterium]
MVNKRHLIVALFLSSTTITYAQVDPKAKVILDDLSAKTKSYTTIKADFTFTNEKKDKTKEMQKGKIEIKGTKYRLEIPGHEIYCDGKTIWDFIKDANEVQMKEMETKEGAINPATIFTLYEKGYKYKLDSEDANTQTISLFPINADKEKFHTVKLVINKVKKQIEGIKLLMKDGTSQSYIISSFVANNPMPDDYFTFNEKAHKGVSVEDLR